MGLSCKILFIIWLCLSLMVSFIYTLQTCEYVAKRSDDLNGHTCLESVRWISPSLMILVLVTSIMGIIGSLCRIEALQSFCNFLLNLGVLTIIIYLIYRILAFGYFQNHPIQSYNEIYYKNAPLTEEYRPILLASVAGENMWPSVEKCFNDVHFCDNEMDSSLQKNYPRLVEGCCYPPSRCGLVKTNGSRIIWEAPKTGVNFTMEDEDCQRWLNKVSQGKCYECDTCKAARITQFQLDFGLINRPVKAYCIFGFVSGILVSFGAFADRDQRKQHEAYYRQP